MHVQLVRVLLKGFGKRLPGQERHGASVHPRVVRGAGHRRKVVLPLLRVDPRASKLPVIRLDAVPAHGFLHRGQRIRGHLVPQPAAAAVYHDADLPHLADAHPTRRGHVENLFHDLDLAVVVARAQGSHLGQPPLLRPLAHLRGVRVQHSTVLLAVLLVLDPGVPLPDRPVHSHLQGLLEVLGGRWDDPLRAHPHGDVVEQGLGEVLLQGPDLILRQVRADQSDSAVDVEAHAPRAHDRRGVVHVHGGHVPDGEAIAGVHVRQGNGLPHDPRKRRHVRELLDRRKEATDVAPLAISLQLLVQEGPQGLVHVKVPGDLHVRHEALIDAVLLVRLLRDVVRLLLERSSLLLHG
mmetsp:Transcript_13717/g.38660  ORF Transcript_13717/g.38660 Transcript_13717/m.38660 type:complete len:351 (+) Transcript_13717:564-1616(+)